MSGNTSGNFTIDNNTGNIAFNANGSSVQSMNITSSLITINEPTNFTNGNVGIGTTNPLNKLTAQASNTGTQVTTVPVAKFINTGNIFSKLILGSDNANFDGVVSMDNDSTLANTKLRIYIGNGTTATTGHSNDHIVLQGNGNVGIGTTSPVQKLQVNGSVYSNGGEFFVNTNKGITLVILKECALPQPVTSGSGRLYLELSWMLMGLLM